MEQQQSADAVKRLSEAVQSAGAGERWSCRLARLHGLCGSHGYAVRTSSHGLHGLAVRAVPTGSRFSRFTRARGSPRVERVGTVLACRFWRFANHKSGNRNRLVGNHGFVTVRTGTLKYGLKDGSVWFAPSQTARMAGSTHN